jgi:hypothetical protein
MKRKYDIVLLLTALSLMFGQFGCSAFYEAFGNLQRLQFKLGSVNNFTLSGINLNKISSKYDFSVTDAAKLVNSFTRGSSPRLLH